MPDTLTITPDLIAQIAGGALSLVLAYVPGLRVRWAALPGAYKRAGMVGLLLLTALLLWVPACVQAAGWQSNLPCTGAGLLDILRLFALALMSSQAVYLIAVRQ